MIGAATSVAAAAAALIALAYQAAALLACLVQRARARRRYARPPDGFAPPVSILKPVRGLDEGFEEAIAGHARLDYPEYELLFGVHDPADPAAPAIERLIRQHPGKRIRLIVSRAEAANGKVGVLIDLAREARHDVLLVADSDIAAPPEYLRRVAAPLADEATGVVTCLYRAASSSLAGKWEALGISTDFIPSTLVAPLVGIREFGLGSTLCFRRTDLEAIGGFEAFKDYIADDYQLAKRITSLGRRAAVSEVVVETTLSDPDWASVWRHQVRWARTIRVSRGGGYAGLPVTHAGVWALAAALAGFWPLAAALLAARVLTGVAGGWGVLRYAPALYLAPLIPLWDFWAFAVWIAGFTGRTVEWRGERKRLLPDGRMEPLADSPAPTARRTA
jgi:ceramide glucosyltransferase